MAEQTKKELSFKQKLLKITESRYFGMLLPVAVLLILVLIFALGNKRFLNSRNLKIIVDQTLIIATVATGASFIYATGNVNIAMGATTGLISALVAVSYTKTNSVFLGILLAFVIGLSVSALAVLIAQKGHVKILYITVVMMTLLLSIQQVTLNNSTMYVDGLKKFLDSINFTYIFYVLFLITSIVIFNFTKIGRTLKFIGTNNECAEATGINYHKYLFISFIIAGIGAALGALMLIQRTGAVGKDTASTYNMDVMLAIVLGGMSVFGGSKSYIHSASLGALTVVVLNNGLLMLGVDASWIQAIRGILFLVLVVMSQPKTDLLPEKD